MHAHSCAAYISTACIQHVRGFNNDNGVLDVLAQEMIRVEGPFFWASSEIATCGQSMSFALHLRISVFLGVIQKERSLIQVYWRWNFGLTADSPLSAVEQRRMCLW